MSVLQVAAWAVIGVAGAALLLVLVGSFLSLTARERTEFLILAAIGVIVSLAIMVTGGAL